MNEKYDFNNDTNEERTAAAYLMGDSRRYCHSPLPQH